MSPSVYDLIDGTLGDDEPAQQKRALWTMPKSIYDMVDAHAAGTDERENRDTYLERLGVKPPKAQPSYENQATGQKEFLGLVPKMQELGAPPRPIGGPGYEPAPVEMPPALADLPFNATKGNRLEGVNPEARLGAEAIQRYLPSPGAKRVTAPQEAPAGPPPTVYREVLPGDARGPASIVDPRLSPERIPEAEARLAQTRAENEAERTRKHAPAVTNPFKFAGNKALDAAQQTLSKVSEAAMDATGNPIPGLAMKGFGLAYQAAVNALTGSPSLEHLGAHSFGGTDEDPNLGGRVGGLVADLAIQGLLLHRFVKAVTPKPAAAPVAPAPPGGGPPPPPPGAGPVPPPASPFGARPRPGVQPPPVEPTPGVSPEAAAQARANLANAIKTATTEDLQQAHTHFNKVRNRRGLPLDDQQAAERVFQKITDELNRRLDAEEAARRAGPRPVPPGEPAAAAAPTPPPPVAPPPLPPLSEAVVPPPVPPPVVEPPLPRPAGAVIPEVRPPDFQTERVPTLTETQRVPAVELPRETLPPPSLPPVPAPVEPAIQMPEAFEVKAPTSETISAYEKSRRLPVGRSLPAKPPETNYLTDLGEYTPRLFHETSLSRAEELLPGSTASWGMGGQNEKFFSNTPDIALGQGKNQGVLIELDAGGIQGQIHTNKPAWKAAWEVGDATEFIVPYAEGKDYGPRVRQVTVLPTAKSESKGEAVRLKNTFADLVRQGWTQTKKADGSVTYTRPGLVPEPPPSREAPVEPENAPPSPTFAYRPAPEPMGTPFKAAEMPTDRYKAAREANRRKNARKELLNSRMNPTEDEITAEVARQKAHWDEVLGLTEGPRKEVPADVQATLSARFGKKRPAEVAQEEAATRKGSPFGAKPPAPGKPAWAVGERAAEASPGLRARLVNEPMEVVVAPIDKALAAAPEFQRLTPEGKGQGAVPGRAKAAGEFFASGKAMDPAEVSVEGNAVGFRDGRHRLVAAWQAGEREAPFLVPKGQAAAFRRIVAGEASPSSALHPVARTPLEPEVSDLAKAQAALMRGETPMGSSELANAIGEAGAGIGRAGARGKKGQLLPARGAAPASGLNISGIVERAMADLRAQGKLPSQQKAAPPLAETPAEPARVETPVSRAEPSIGTEPEWADRGRRVYVGSGAQAYEGSIERTLKTSTGGTMYEVRPDGKDTTFRVGADRVKFSESAAIPKDVEAAFRAGIAKTETPAEPTRVESKATGGKPLFDSKRNLYSYRVEDVPSDRIVASHLPNGEVDPRAPRLPDGNLEFQARDFKIGTAKDISADPNLDAHLVPEGNSTVGGSPVLWKDPNTGLYHVVAGNHRYIGAKIAGRFEKSARLRVLAEGTTREEAQRIAANSQDSSAAPQSSLEQARAIVRGLGLTPEDAPRRISGDPITPDTVEQFVNQNPAFARKVLGDAGIDPKRWVAEDASEKINTALAGMLPKSVQDVAAAVGGRVEEGMKASAPALLALERMAKAGEIPQEYNILPSFERAAEVMRSLAGKGKSKADILKSLNTDAVQPTFGDIADNPVRRLRREDAGLVFGLLKLEGLKDPAGYMAERMRALLRAPEEAKQGGLFGGKPPSPTEVLFGKQIADQAAKFKPNPDAPLKVFKFNPPAAEGSPFGKKPEAPPATGPRGKGKPGEAGFFDPAGAIKKGWEAGISLFDRITRENAPLRKHLMEEGFNVADELKAARVRESAMADTAQSMANAAFKGITRADREGPNNAAEYPMLLDIRRRLNDGQPQSMTFAEVDAKIAATIARFGTPKLNALMANMAKINEELYMEGVRIGGLKAPPTDPVARKAFFDRPYVHHMVTKWLEEHGASSGPAAPGAKHPGSMMRAVGSESPIEPDAYRALEKNANDMLVAGLRHNMIQDMKQTFSLNESARDGLLLPDEKNALYNFGEGKGEKAGLVPGHTEKLLKEALDAERVDPNTLRRYVLASVEDPVTHKVTRFRHYVEEGDPFLVPDGVDKAGQPRFKNYGHLLPGDLAPEIVKAHARGPMNDITYAWTAAGNKLKVGILANNISYAIRQGLQEDPASMLSNISPEHGPAALNMYRKMLGKLTVEAWKEMGGVEMTASGPKLGTNPQRSPILEGLRRAGYWGGHQVDYLMDRVDAEGHIVSELRLPWQYKTFGQKAKQVGKKIALPNETANQVREASLKIAISKMGGKMGMTPRQRLRFSHERSGNYWERSPLDRFLAPLTQFLKWPTEALLRVTRHIAEDPKTGAFAASGKGFLRALRTSPALKAALIGSAVVAWNTLRDPEATKKMLKSGMFLDQPILLWRDPDNPKKWITFGLSDYRSILNGVVDFMVEMGHGHPVEAMKGAGKGVATRVGALPALGIEMMTGEKTTGGDVVPPGRYAMGEEKQADLNWKNKALPFSDWGVHALEKLAPTPSRYITALFGEKKLDAVDKGRLVGSPFAKFDPADRAISEGYRHDRVYYNEWLTTRDPEVRAELMKWARENGRLQAWGERRKAGGRAFAQENAGVPEIKREVRRAKIP